MFISQSYLLTSVEISDTEGQPPISLHAQSLLPFFDEKRNA